MLMTEDHFVGSTKLESCGKAMPSTLLKITDENGNDLKIGEVGRAAWKSPNNMLGYYGNEEKTKEAIKNGWFIS